MQPDWQVLEGHGVLRVLQAVERAHTIGEEVEGRDRQHACHEGRVVRAIPGYLLGPVQPRSQAVGCTHHGAWW